MRTLLGLATLALVGCGTDVSDTPPQQTGPTARATWYQDVAPIVSKHCMTCHQDGGIAPFPLVEYEDARDNAKLMLDQVTANTMPPFNASEEDDCTPRFNWKDDPRLTSQDKLTLQWWLDDGTVAGTKVDVPVPASTDLTGVTMTLAPTTPFVASGSRDQFICTVLDPATTGTFLTGLQVRPGNPTVVHHAVISEVFATGANADAIAGHATGVPWDCSTQQQPADLVVSIWTPGNEAMQTPSELAVPVLAGARFVMQIHYHPAGTVAAPDTTSIDLRTSSVWPQKLYFVGAFGNATTAPMLLPDPDDRIAGTPEFRIPANKADHVEHMQIPVPDLGGLTGAQFYSVNPHMHLIGTHVNATITRPAPRGTDPQTECLANGAWNFDWQRTYIYDAPIAQLPTAMAGDVIDVVCHWNNTMQNPFVQRSLADAGLVAPVDVTLGEGSSTDEMCLEIFGISVDAPPAPTALTESLLPLPLLHALSARNRSK